MPGDEKSDASNNQISDRVKEFLFRSIDSVEQLEVLHVLRTDPSKSWNAETLSKLLRSNPSSVRQRLVSLRRLKLVKESSEAAGGFSYVPTETNTELLLDELFENYQVRRHQVLALIFSPLKEARAFANAFVLGASPLKKEDSSDG